MDDIKTLKQELLRGVQDRLLVGTQGARAQGADAIRPESRLAVGYSRHGTELKLEVRVQKKSGTAWRRAKAIEDKYPAEVNVAVIESVAVAPSKAVLESAPFGSGGFTHQPLRLGSSVSHRDEPAPGTLGGFVTDKSGDLGIVSCSHVLALSGTAHRRDRVVHPGRGDVTQLTDEHLIGHLGRFTVLSKGGANALDAAYAHLEEDVEHEGNVVPKGVGAPPAHEGKGLTYDAGALGRLQADAVLGKIGRSTGYSDGHLSALSVDGVPVLVHGIGLVYFDNCIEVRWRAVNRPFSRPGDSGASVFTEAREAVGLHFAAGDVKRDGRDLKVSYACELAAIMAENLFNLTWLD